MSQCQPISAHKTVKSVSENSAKLGHTSISSYDVSQCQPISAHKTVKSVSENSTKLGHTSISLLQNKSAMFE